MNDAARPAENVRCDERARPFKRPRRSRLGVLLGWGVLAVVSALAADRPAAGNPTGSAEKEGWEALFDGKTLSGWAPSGFETGGAAKVVPAFADGRAAIVVEKGTTLSGITWTKGAGLPRTNYELSLEAMRMEGSDFFCGLTFPVGKSACSFIVGGWGGSAVGISSVDHVDASENETSRDRQFADRRWYRIFVRVTEGKIEAWIDDEKMVDLETKNRVIGLRPGDIQKSLPLGLATYMTRAAFRDIRLRRL